MSAHKGSSRQVATSGFIFAITGNPFVDSGLAALCILTNRKEPSEITLDDLKAQIDYIARLYSGKGWRDAFHGQVFPNAELVNPASKDGPGQYRAALAQYLSQVTPGPGRGNCISCGQRDGIPVEKTRVPLLGSGKLVNFFPAGSSGERFCPNCILAIQFMPLSIEKVGKPLMLHTMNWTIQMAYARKIVGEARAREAAKQQGLVDTGQKKPAGVNAVYAAIEDILNDERVAVEDISNLEAPLRFYHFSNYGQGPEMDMYDIPSAVFEFLTEVHRSRSKDDWRRVVARGFRKKKRRENEEDLFKTTPNMVYQRLTKGESILYYFLAGEFEVIGDWNLVSLYLRKVRRMDEKQIETIRRVADRYLEFSKETGSIKRITQLHWAKSYRDFRSALLRVQEELTRRKGESLLTFDEYVLDLAPEGGASWQETRDLLLFRIYEKGASWLSGKKSELEQFASNEGELEEQT